MTIKYETSRIYTLNGLGQPLTLAKLVGISLHLNDVQIVQFRNILQRALNCAPPHEEQYKDWFELAEMLEDRKEIKGPSQKD